MIYLFYLLFLAVYNFIKENLKENLTEEQIFLKKLTREDFSKKEAEYLWKRIGDHKWYISERLGRDVGVTVAAIDFFENIYESESGAAKLRRFRKSNLEAFGTLSLA